MNSVRNRVRAATAPGMTTGDAPDRQPASGNSAMLLHGFESIGGTGGLEPATAQWPEQHLFQRRNPQPIASDAKDQDVLGSVHSASRSFKSLAFRNVVKKSFSTSAQPLP